MFWNSYHTDLHQWQAASPQSCTRACGYCSTVVSAMAKQHRTKLVVFFQLNWWLHLKPAGYYFISFLSLCIGPSHQLRFHAVCHDLTKNETYLLEMMIKCHHLPLSWTRCILCNSKHIKASEKCYILKSLVNIATKEHTCYATHHAIIVHFNAAMF